jgi:hypothetical protein
MPLFRRVTRYRISPTQDPRENRPTEVTAAVLGRVDGLAHDVMDVALATVARRRLYVTVAVDGYPASGVLRRRRAGHRQRPRSSN